MVSNLLKMTQHFLGQRQAVVAERVGAVGHAAWPRGQTSLKHSNCPPGIPLQPSEQKLVFDCIQRQIVFAAWPQSLQQQNILMSFADSEQRCFAIAAGSDVRMSEGQHTG